MLAGLVVVLSLLECNRVKGCQDHADRDPVITSRTMPTDFLISDALDGAHLRGFGRRLISGLVRPERLPPKGAPKGLW